MLGPPAVEDSIWEKWANQLAADGRPECSACCSFPGHARTLEEGPDGGVIDKPDPAPGHFELRCDNRQQLGEEDVGSRERR